MSDVLTRFSTKRELEKAAPAPAPKQRAKKPPFAPVPLDEAAPYFRAIDGGSGAVVVTLLFYMAWKMKDRTFPLSNELCGRYGVSRWAKYRALARLKKAGMIATQQLGRQATTVTLLTR
jgi:hypothetical protein